ncbi:MAG: prepilin peptidase [Ignavibacteriaceae bacterium]
MNELIVVLVSISLGSFGNNIISYYTGVSKLDLLRSHCACGEKLLRAYELIPILSYITLKGKCSCGKIISLRYLLVELSAGLLGIFCYYSFPFPLFLIYFLIFFILLIIGIIDLVSFTIPNMLISALLLLTLMKNFFVASFSISLLNLTVTAFVILMLMSLNLLFSRIYNREAIGAGDIKLLFTLALTFDFLIVIIGVWVSSLLAMAGYFLLKAFTLKFKNEEKIPFGFFISICFIAIAFWEDKISAFYYQLMGM